MKLASFNYGGFKEIGLLRENLVIPIRSARELLGRPPGPSTMLDLIDAGPCALIEVRKLDEALDDDAASALALSGAVLLAPIPRPRGNILCIGRNYADHAIEQGASPPLVPVFFTKAPLTVIGPEVDVPYPPGVTELDYEGELALIIGRGGRDISRDQALNHVFGFTVLNDVTARDIQRQHLQWFKGKSFDGTCPLGPAIVPADEVGDLGSLRVRTFVNGELRQNQPISDMIFDIPTVIAELSAGMTLEPGVIIATGTPAGVGAPTRTFLQPGDIVEVHVDRVGVLRSRIGPKSGS